MLTAFPNSALAQGTKPPATIKDIFVYQNMALVVFCRANLEGIPFKKAMAIAVPSNVEILMAMHDGQVPVEDGKTKKLTPKQLIDPASTQLLFAAERACPKAIPADVKKQLSEVKKKLSSKK